MSFWQRKKVFLTGHTGFKGSWLCLWLNSLGAEVTGYALEPPTTPNLYELARIDEMATSIIADVRDLERLKAEMVKASPDIVIHMAAQPLVCESYKIPVDTYAINVMGTVHLLEAVRSCPSVRAVVNVTTDKVYENHEWVWGYRENEPIGGYDPYSNSKGCSELVTAAYRASFFNPQRFAEHGVGLASARAGNVIGGGDWASDRLIPDIIRAILAGEPVRIRNPHAIRPWQHVLEPLSGYLVLSQKLYENGARFAEGWNFGPSDEDSKPVEWIVNRLCEQWGNGARYEINKGDHPHEANYLKLDCSKAKSGLGWHSRWGLNKTIDSIVDWTRECLNKMDMREVCMRQIHEYSNSEVLH